MTLEHIPFLQHLGNGIDDCCSLEVTKVDSKYIFQYISSCDSTSNPQNPEPWTAVNPFLFQLPTQLDCTKYDSISISIHSSFVSSCLVICTSGLRITRLHHTRCDQHLTPILIMTRISIVKKEVSLYPRILRIIMSMLAQRFTSDTDVPRDTIT